MNWPKSLDGDFQKEKKQFLVSKCQMISDQELQRTVIYGMVIVSRNLERTNQNDRFKITALEIANN